MTDRILWAAVLCIVVAPAVLLCLLPRLAPSASFGEAKREGAAASKSEAAGEENGEKHEYKWRFEKGEKYLLKNTAEYKVSRTMSGKTETTERTSGIECNLDVQDIEQDGSAWVIYTYKNISVKLKGPGVDVKFDSTRDKEVPLQAISLAMILGESFYFKMTSQGKVERINGLDMMAANMKAKIPGVPNRDKIADSVKRQFDEQTIRKELERIFAIYPADGVGIGDSWSSSELSTEGTGMVIEKTFRLKERKDEVAVIDVNVVIKPNPQPQPVRIGGMTARWEASGWGHGSIEVDESTGRIIRGQVTRDWVEDAKVVSAGAMRRPEGPVASSRTQVVTTFEMSERKE
jgi:hypothetical protein